MDLGLSERTFVITGGTRGLGRAVAEVLVSEGASVVVSSRDPAHVDRTVEQLGDRAAGVAADITDPAAPARLLATARQAFGGVHGAFISHGGPAPGQPTDLDDDTLRAAFELSLAGPVRVAREVATDLGEGGAIVVLTSTSSIEPLPYLASSNVTRPAVWGYVKHLADEVGPRGVRVNAVLAGPFATERQTEVLERRSSQTGLDIEQLRDEYAKQVPLGRVGQPAELGRVAAFLLSPAASFVTGVALPIDGGRVRGL